MAYTSPTVTVELSVDALAAYRLTRLATTDAIADVPRTALQRRSVFLLDLLNCPWCTSVWVSFGVVAARRSVPRLWDPVATALALSAVAGFIAERVAAD